MLYFDIEINRKGNIDCIVFCIDKNKFKKEEEEEQTENKVENESDNELVCNTSNTKEAENDDELDEEIEHSTLYIP